MRVFLSSCIFWVKVQVVTLQVVGLQCTVYCCRYKNKGTCSQRSSEVQCIAAVQQPVQYSSCLQYCLPTVLGTLYRPVYIKLYNFSPNSRLQYSIGNWANSAQLNNTTKAAGPVPCRSYFAYRIAAKRREPYSKIMLYVDYGTS